MGEYYELKNRYLHIAWKESAYSDEKQPIEPIGKINLSEILETKTVSSRTKKNISKLYDEFGNEKIFGRRDVMAVLGITERPATALIGRMYELEVTERITGAGSLYRFIRTFMPDYAAISAGEGNEKIINTVHIWHGDLAGQGIK